MRMKYNNGREKTNDVTNRYYLSLLKIERRKKEYVEGYLCIHRYII